MTSVLHLLLLASAVSGAKYFWKGGDLAFNDTDKLVTSLLFPLTNSFATAGSMAPCRKQQQMFPLLTFQAILFLFPMSLPESTQPRVLCFQLTDP